MNRGGMTAPKHWQQLCPGLWPTLCALFQTVFTLVGYGGLAGIPTAKDSLRGVSSAHECRRADGLRRRPLSITYQSGVGCAACHGHGVYHLATGPSTEGGGVAWHDAGVPG